MRRKRTRAQVSGGTTFLCYLLSLCTIFFGVPKIVKRIDQKTYQYEYEVYNDAVEQIKNLFKELKLENATQCFYMFTFLLNEGYLSINKNFYYETDDKVLYDICSLLGYDVILGKACCRHISNLFNDVLLACGYDSCIIPCKTNDSSYVNHVINVVNDNGEIKYFDPTNCLILDKVNNNLVTLKSLNSPYTLKLAYIDISPVIAYNNLISYLKINKEIILDNQELNYSDFFDNEIKTYEIANNNINIIEKFIDSYQEELTDKKHPINVKILYN